MLPAKFGPNAQFFEVEGIPVASAWYTPLFCAAFNVSALDSDSMRRDGAPISEAAFKVMVATDPRAPQYFVVSEGRGRCRMRDGTIGKLFEATPERHKAEGDAMIAALGRNLNRGDRDAP